MLHYGQTACRFYGLKKHRTDHTGPYMGTRTPHRTFFPATPAVCVIQTAHIKYLSSKIVASDLMSSSRTDGVPSWNTLNAWLCRCHTSDHTQCTEISRWRRHMRSVIAFSSYWNNIALENCITLCIMLLANIYLLIHNSSRLSQVL